jgi:glycyl-tRNA synthetase (class II)
MKITLKKTTNKTMKNYMTINGQIGYLNLRTGKYKWVKIIGMNSNELQMREERKNFANHYTEKTEDIIKYLKTPSIDFKDGRPLIKYKGTTKLY